MFDVVFQAIVFKQICALIAVFGICCKERIFEQIAHFVKPESRAHASYGFKDKSCFRLLGKQLFLSIKNGMSYLEKTVFISCA